MADGEELWNGDVALKPGQGAGRLFDGLSTRFRQKRDNALRAFIARLAASRAADVGPLRIIDLGGTWAYWERVGIDFLDTHNIEITCINYTESELRAHGTHRRLKAEVGDARNLPKFADNSFDMVHSNSVIEHVGRFGDMADFAREVRRLAPAHYVQTPYFWFPIDPHFPRVPLFHWMPESWRLKLLGVMKVGWGRPTKDTALAMSMINNVVLLDWRQFRHLFPDSSYRAERLALLPKSMIAERG